MRAHQEVTAGKSSSASGPIHRQLAGRPAARRMLYSILVLGVCLASLGIFAVRAFGAPNLPRIQRGTFRVEFSDHLGRPQAVPTTTLPIPTRGCPRSPPACRVQILRSDR